MARFFGNVAYVTTVETAPDVWTDNETIRQYYGNEESFGANRKFGDKINDDITVTKQLSIVADPFAYENFMNIRWVEWLGKKWKVSDVQVDRPRLRLSIGGIYNA